LPDVALARSNNNGIGAQSISAIAG